MFLTEKYVVRCKKDVVFSIAQLISSIKIPIDHYKGCGVLYLNLFQFIKTSQHQRNYSFHPYYVFVRLQFQRTLLTRYNERFFFSNFKIKFTSVFLRTIPVTRFMLKLLSISNQSTLDVSLYLLKLNEICII